MNTEIMPDHVQEYRYTCTKFRHERNVAYFLEEFKPSFTGP